MEAIEFSAKIVNGAIQIPLKYSHYPSENVRVILLFKQIDFLNQKEKLENIFLKMKQMSLFSAIENPMKWQRNLRNEWE